MSCIRRLAGCLAEAAATVGSVQIRNVVTIGGSVANDSPCGDVLPALLVLGSTATVLDEAGVTRRRPVAELLGGSGQTRLSCGEVITELEFPALGPAERSAFARVASRSTVSVAKLSLAIIVAYAALDGRLRDARVALGAVGRAASRDDTLERVLEGRRADSTTSALFAAECTAACTARYPWSAIASVQADGRPRIGLRCAGRLGAVDCTIGQRPSTSVWGMSLCHAEIYDTDRCDSQLALQRVRTA